MGLFSSGSQSYDKVWDIGMGQPKIMVKGDSMLIKQPGRSISPIPLLNISAVIFQPGGLLSHINIIGAGTTLFSCNIGAGFRDKSARIASEINAYITQKNSTNEIIENKSSDADEIEKLGKLLEKGLITAEEFKEKKKQILNI